MTKKMNNHLCRAKKYGTEKWVYGYYVAVPLEYGHGEIVHLIIEQDCEYREYGEFSFTDVHKIDHDTICRCTGVEDINGNLIFEGDYIRTYYGRECMVVWFSSNAHNGWDLIPIGGFNCKPPIESTIWAKENLQVIGNKFDNTELMEE